MSNGLPFMDISGLDEKLISDPVDIMHLQDIFGFDIKMTITNLLKNLDNDTVSAESLTSINLNVDSSLDLNVFKGKESWGLVSNIKGYVYNIPSGNYVTLPEGNYIASIEKGELERYWDMDGGFWSTTRTFPNGGNSYVSIPIYSNGTNYRVYASEVSFPMRIILFDLAGNLVEIPGYTPLPYNYG